MRTVEQEFAMAQELAVRGGLRFTQVVDMEGNRIHVIYNGDGRKVTVETWQEAVIAARIMMENF